VCVGVFVLGTSEERDSDVNIWMRSSKAQTVRVHIHWMERGMRGKGRIWVRGRLTELEDTIVD